MKECSTTTEFLFVVEFRSLWSPTSKCTVADILVWMYVAVVKHKARGTTKVIWKHCACTTRRPHTSHFPHFTPPAKSSRILMDPYRTGLLQALSGWRLNLREIRELWRKDIKIDCICFWMWRGNGCGPQTYRVKEELFLSTKQRSCEEKCYILTGPLLTSQHCHWQNSSHLK